MEDSAMDSTDGFTSEPTTPTSASSNAISYILLVLMLVAIAGLIWWYFKVAANQNLGGSVPAPDNNIFADNPEGRITARNLRKLPMEKFDKSKHNETCSICLVDFNAKDKVRVLPCNHVYHKACIDPWLTKSLRVCPYCKSVVYAPGEQIDLESGRTTEGTPISSPLNQQNRGPDRSMDSIFERFPDESSSLFTRCTNYNSQSRPENTTPTPKTEEERKAEKEASNARLQALVRTALLGPPVIESQSATNIRRPNPLEDAARKENQSDPNRRKSI